MRLPIRLLSWILPLSLGIALSLTTGCNKCSRQKTTTTEKPPEDHVVNLPPDRSKPYKPDYKDISLRRVLQKVIKPSANAQTANPGSNVTVTMQGWIYDPKQLGNKGFQFDEGGRPVSFNVGKGQTLMGLDRSIVGMRVGEKREFVIPADLAYGDQQHESIPPGSHVLLEVELLKVSVKK